MVAPILFISTLKTHRNILRKVFLFSKFFIYKLLTIFMFVVGNLYLFISYIYVSVFSFFADFLAYLVLFYINCDLIILTVLIRLLIIFFFARKFNTN